LTQVGLDCVIAGWGITNRSLNILPTKLQALHVKIDDPIMCKWRWQGQFVSDFNICAWVPGTLNKGACFVIKLL